MRSAYLRLVLAVLAAGLLSVGVAHGEGTSPQVPYGKYQGSAVRTGDVSKAKPFPVTVYIAEGKNGQTDVTGVTDLLPIPVSVEGTARQVPGGWDISVSVNQKTLKLIGNGIVRLRPGEGDWVLYGDGSGSFRGKSGSGRAYAKRVAKTTTLGGQIKDAFEGFVGGGESDDQPVPMPAEYVEQPAAEAPVGADSLEVLPPLGFFAILILLLFWILLLIFGLVL